MTTRSWIRLGGGAMAAALVLFFILKFNSMQAELERKAVQISILTNEISNLEDYNNRSRSLNLRCRDQIIEITKDRQLLEAKTRQLNREKAKLQRAFAVKRREFNTVLASVNTCERLATEAKSQAEYFSMVWGNNG